MGTQGRAARRGKPAALKEPGSEVVGQSGWGEKEQKEGGREVDGMSPGDREPEGERETGGGLRHRGRGPRARPRALPSRGDTGHGAACGGLHATPASLLASAAPTDACSAAGEASGRNPSSRGEAINPKSSLGTRRTRPSPAQRTGRHGGGAGAGAGPPAPAFPLGSLSSR